MIVLKKGDIEYLNLMEGSQEDWVSLGYFKTQSLSSTFPSCQLFPRTLVKADSHLAWLMSWYSSFRLLSDSYYSISSTISLHLLMENICVYFQMDAGKAGKPLVKDFLWRNNVNSIEFLTYKKNWKWAVLDHMCCLSLNALTQHEMRK